MNFDDVLPLLIDACRRKVLVPFIGSGMSCPTCTLWQPFVEKLAERAGVPNVQGMNQLNGRGGKLEPSELYRLADKAVHRLLHERVNTRAESFRYALSPHKANLTEPCAIPPQTEALALLSWPLVLTTNYDDLYLAARTCRGSAPSRVLCRSLADCHELVRALDEPVPLPVLWALQGFLGGQMASPETFVPDAVRRSALVEQLVVGHQQYQNVINAQLHFRRAFAEVYRRRSILFLGSGLAEDYVINLFGEMIHHYGPSPYSHFALLKNEQAGGVDPQFLQTRLGIVPVFYNEHGELPGLLKRLSAHVLKGSKTLKYNAEAPVAWMMHEVGFSLMGGDIWPAQGSRQVKLLYRAFGGADLPVPVEGDRACVVVSLDRAHGHVIESSEAKNLLKKAEDVGLIKHADEGIWKGIGEPLSSIQQFGNSPIFGICSRTNSDAQGEKVEQLDLSRIADTVYSTLRAVDDAGFRTVHLGPVLPNGIAGWHSFYPFVHTLTGIRRFFADASRTRIQELLLYVLDPAIWSSVVAGKIPVSEILSSAVTRIWVEIRDSEGRPENYSVTIATPITVGQLKESCGLATEQWNAEIRPSIVNRDSSMVVDDATNVPPASIVVFSPRPPN